MKYFLFIIGLFIVYVQLHCVFVYGCEADATAYTLTGIGIAVMLLSFAKVRSLK